MTTGQEAELSIQVKVLGKIREADVGGRAIHELMSRNLHSFTSIVHHKECLV